MSFPQSFSKGEFRPKKRRQAPDDVSNYAQMDTPEEELSESPEEEYAEHLSGGKTDQRSRQLPTKPMKKSTVEVETGLPRDRMKGYRKRAQTGFTGADARAALVGAMPKSFGRPGAFAKKEKFKGKDDENLY